MSYGVKYIGSKASLIPFILQTLDTIKEPIATAIDVFTGTTRVAQALKKRGLKVTTSDLAWASKVYSDTWIGNHGPTSHLQARIDTLNGLTGIDGWITTNYCDVLGDNNGIVRVWQPKNGKKADAIRDQIEAWYLSKQIQGWEANVLITSLILALDKVDNTVGVQQAYLKEWCQRSHKDLLLELPPYIEGQKGTHLTGDCLQLTYEPADIAYLDPPYSGHSYSTYYHIWDSIAFWDKPEVGLKTNRRVDRISGHAEFDPHMNSLWNSKKSALNAFEQLIDRLPVKYVLISYSDESLIEIDALKKLLSKYKEVTPFSVDYKRNIMCQIGNASKDATEDTVYKTENKEYIFLIKK